MFRKKERNTDLERLKQVQDEMRNLNKYKNKPMITVGDVVSSTNSPFSYIYNNKYTFWNGEEPEDTQDAVGRFMHEVLINKREPFVKYSASDCIQNDSMLFWSSMAEYCHDMKQYCKLVEDNGKRYKELQKEEAYLCENLGIFLQHDEGGCRTCKTI